MRNKKILKFKYYKDCLLNNDVILKLNQRFKRGAINVYTEEINRISLSSNDNKRLQTLNAVTSYPYGTNAGKIWKTEMLCKYKLLILMIIQMKIKQSII